MMPRRQKIILATRSSPLALRQAELVKEYLLARGMEADFELLPLTTTGDRQRDWNLAEKGGKGLFTKELEEAVLSGQADIAVHSAKDLPTVLADGLEVAAYLPRADPRDALILRAGIGVPATVASSSPRRRLQASALYPEAQFIDIRGNIHTRLRKIHEGYADATLLAQAALNRLSLSHYADLTFRTLTLQEMLPAVGQGAIALECTHAFAPYLAPYSDSFTHQAVTLERLFLETLGGGCQVAFAAHFTGTHLLITHERLPYYEAPFAAGDPTVAKIHMKGLLRALGLV